MKILNISKIYRSKYKQVNKDNNKVNNKVLQINKLDR